MDRISGSRYIELHFDAQGTVVEADRTALTAALASDGISHLVVLSHGWKFEPPGPRILYEALWREVVRNLEEEQGTYVVAGVVWPSKRYTVGIDTAHIQAAPGVAGTLAAEGDGGEPIDLTDAEFAAALEDALDGLDLGGDAHAALAAHRANPGERTAEDLLRAVAANCTFQTTDAELAAVGAHLEALPDAIGDTLAIFAEPPRLELAPELAQTLGLAGAVRGFFTGAQAAVIRVLEQFSFFEMKARAGIVGKSLGLVLSEINPPQQIVLHMVGHSFGARVVTAAASAFRPPDHLSLFSLTLLQGAFSHNGLSAKRGGAFHSVVSKPSGPVAISHTHNDWACTTMYALASRVSGDVTQGLGDANDAFGAMGANGARFDTTETAASIGEKPFRPERGKITNFRSDSFIKDHNDIENSEVGALVAATILA